MLKRTITLTNPSGLHARPAAILVSLANSFTSDITIQYRDKTANAKSILSVLSLGASQGAILDIAVTGRDEASAVDTLLSAFSRNLEEI